MQKYFVDRIDDQQFPNKQQIRIYFVKWKLYIFSEDSLKFAVVSPLNLRWRWLLLWFGT